MIRKDLGDFLVENGVINTQQLGECQTAIKETGQTLANCLLEKEFINSHDLSKALASYASVDFVEAINDKMADLLLLSKVPLTFLRENVIIPVRINDQATLLVANPMNFQPIDELNMLLGSGIPHAVAPEKVIIDAINRYYPLEGTKEMIEELEEEEEKEIEAVEFEDIGEKDILAMATEAPIIKLVNHILFQAVKRGASDIHIEPFEKELSVRYRIDGVLYEVMKPPKRIQSALISRIKIMANLNIAEKRVPQDGRIDIRIAGKSIDIRVSILPVNFGERVVMRLLDQTVLYTSLVQQDPVKQQHSMQF